MPFFLFRLRLSSSLQLSLLRDTSLGIRLEVALLAGDSSGRSTTILFTR